MLKPTRYQVRGTRPDTGAQVEGYLIECEKSETGYCVWRKEGDTYHMTDVYPESVKPLAAAVLDKRWVDDPAGNVGTCPNCGADVDDDEIHGGEWCGNCGQRLDWQGDTENGEGGGHAI